jgi:hypothetical protein
MKLGFGRLAASGAWCNGRRFFGLQMKRKPGRLGSRFTPARLTNTISPKLLRAE